jgi:drug/metabolite transporter (DMT)-like permease
MLRLLSVSLIWSFSFVLIKGRLAGVDASLVALIRLALSALIFLPFFRPAKLGGRAPWQALRIGFFQFGLMYVLYIQSYAYLAAWQVALFTLTTPLWVSLLSPKEYSYRLFIAALLSVLAAALVLPSQGEAGSASWLGFALLQAANLCFAWGQLAWRRWMQADDELQDHEAFFLPFAGALFLPALALALGVTAGHHSPDSAQILVLLYLGVVASGLGFFLWNSGARQVRPATLAVMNNAKIPLGVLAALLILKETANLPMLLISIALLLLALKLGSKPTRVT